MNTTALRNAYDDLLAAAETPSSPPPPGEWDHDHPLAHLISVDANITAVALAVTSGERTTYDNRISLDHWNLDRLVSVAGGTSELLERVRHHGELLCTVADRLDDSDLQVMVPTLILSNDKVMLDQPIPLRALIKGLAEVHIPSHTDQLRALHPA